MSTMRWTYKSQETVTALRDLQLPSVGKSLKIVKKGDTLPVQVYELYIDSRGNPQGQTSMDYYYSSEPISKKESKPTLTPPKGQRLSEGKDFTLTSEPETMPSKPVKELLSNNKTVMLLGLIVIGYFAYKYYNKK